MTLTASRHRKCSIALTMLLVWVLALLSGVANACLSAPRSDLTRSGLQAPAPEAGRHAPIALQTHSAGTADRTLHDQHPAKVSCRNSGDESSQTPLKQRSKLDTPDLQIVAPPTRAWPSDPHLAPAVLIRAAFVAFPPPSPPLRVQFSRLAL